MNDIVTRALIVHVHPGDTIVLGPSETYGDNPPGLYRRDQELTVCRAWARQIADRWTLQLMGPPSVALGQARTPHPDVPGGRRLELTPDKFIMNFGVAALDEATIVRRTDTHPVQRYEVGQRVRVTWGRHADRLGVVRRADHLEDAPGIPGPSCYTIGTISSGDVCVAPEHMAPEPSPTPTVGQRWVCLTGPHRGDVMTVVEVDDDGLTARCGRETDGAVTSVGRIALESRHYGLATSQCRGSRQTSRYWDIHVAGVRGPVRVWR